MAKLILADDHSVLRGALKTVLESSEGWEVVAQAANGFETLSAVEEHAPDVVVLDLCMPGLGGIETINRLSQQQNRPKILVLTARNDDKAIEESLRAGADAYVTKNSGLEELRLAIAALLRGNKYLSPDAARSALSQRNHNGHAKTVIEELTQREREVLKLLAEGCPNREVAKLLHISPRTVDSHRSNILKKLGAHSNAELVQVAIRHRVIEA